MDLALHEKCYVIIGNGVAGTTAAETLRKNDPTCSIHLLTNEPYPLYNRVSLPRFLQICQIYLASLPLHQRLLPSEDLSSARAFARAREYLVAFIVAGMMADPEETKP